MGNIAQLGNVIESCQNDQSYLFLCSVLCSRGVKLSEFFDCHSGVKQGCLLSPLCFP